MKRHAAILTALLAAALGCEQAPQPEQKATAARQAAPAPDPDYPMQPKEVVPGVYALITPSRDFPSPENKGWNSNTAFVVTGDGVLVVDTGSSERIGAAIRAAVRRVTDRPVRWIVNTHGHGDHWLGNKTVAGPGTEIIATSKVRERILNETDYWVDLFNRMTEGATGRSEARAPSTVIDARTRRTLGGVAVEFIPSGDSHSPGDLLVWLPQKKVLIAGDVVYSDRLPNTFEANVKQWIAFLGELERLGAEVVIPGHGDVAGPESVHRQREYFTQLWATVQAGYEAGQADFEILPEVRKRLARFASHYPGFDERIGESVSHVYLQVEQSAF